MVARPPDADATLVLRLRRSRLRAREAAVAEVVALLRDLGARPGRGGPLSEVAGVAWVALPASSLEAASQRLSRLGYSGAVDLVRPLDSVPADSPYPIVRWRRADFALMRAYEEADEQLRAGAPDRRTFLLECGDGVVRPIAGYRGGRGPLDHRALPVEDARLLVNLVALPARGRLLDPFAGAGGVVIEARLAGWTVASLDSDGALRYGLRALSDLHVLADATDMPFGNASVDAVATEPPHHPSALGAVTAAVGEICRVLKVGGRAAVLVASHQAGAVRLAAGDAGMALQLDSRIDRRGTDVSCLCWLRTR
jgi:SAM-dependent methyltransferase